MSLNNKNNHVIDKRGLLNIKKQGLSKRIDLYHYMMRMGWGWFFLTLSIVYLVINSFFAFLYYIVPGSISNADPQSYWDAFVFSFQTSSTIGYGHLRPETDYANFIVILDTLAGFLFLALVTGSVFSRFARPTARVLFSKNILINKMNGVRTLMFRIGNSRTNQIVDAEVSVALSMPETTFEGVNIRRMYDLKLIRKHSPLFSLSWTVMHAVDESSPIFKMSLDELKDCGVYFIVTLKGVDDVFMQTVHDRNVYFSDDLVFDHKFVDVMTSSTENNPANIDYRRFHDIEPVTL